MKEKVERIDVSKDSAEKLKEIFFGGMPWLIICADSGGVKTDVLKGVYDITSVATMNCSLPLPSSGVSSYERFQLTRSSKSATVFFVANGDKPKQVKSDLLTDNEKLLKFLKGSAPMKPLVTLKTTEDLSNFCTSHKYCALFLAEGNQTFYSTSSSFRDSLLQLRQEHRNVRFAVVDVALYKTTLKEQLDALFTPPVSKVQLVMIQQMKDEAGLHQSYLSYFTESFEDKSDLSFFIQQSLAKTTSDGLVKLNSGQKIRIRDKSKKAASEPSSTEQTKSHYYEELRRKKMMEEEREQYTGSDSRDDEDHSSSSHRNDDDDDDDDDSNHASADSHHRHHDEEEVEF